MPDLGVASFIGQNSVACSHLTTGNTGKCNVLCAQGKREVDLDTEHCLESSKLKTDYVFV